LCPNFNIFRPNYEIPNSKLKLPSVSDQLEFKLIFVCLVDLVPEIPYYTVFAHSYHILIEFIVSFVFMVNLFYLKIGEEVYILIVKFFIFVYVRDKS